MKEKHCDKCSFETQDGRNIIGCTYCGCHDVAKPAPKEIIRQGECGYGYHIAGCTCTGHSNNLCTDDCKNCLCHPVAKPALVLKTCNLTCQYETSHSPACPLYKAVKWEIKK